MLNLAHYDVFRKNYSENFKDLTLFDKIKESFEAFDYLIDNGYRNWIITFSGGKDSTTTLVLALEYAKLNRDKVKRIDVVYADTLIEIPSIHQFAIKILEYLKEFANESALDINTHVTFPEIKERYWVKVLGYGYPPPHQKFRWCTKRLKIDPSEQSLAKYIISEETAILTGVRFGESKSRDMRLNDSCIRGGECGQGLWFKKSERLKIGYLAPIINWQSCEVWDLIAGFAPAWGYPIKELEKIYNGHDTRFGCWMCTVIKQDKAMAKTIAQEEWAHLQPMADFRNYVWETTRNPNKRVLRKDGQVGKLRLNVRKELLRKLILVEKQTGIKLIHDDEVIFIQKLWENK